MGVFLKGKVGQGVTKMRDALYLSKHVERQEQ